MPDYGRYVVGYDDGEYSAVPKCRTFKCKGQQASYAFPKEGVYTAPNLEQLYKQMANDGASGCIRRRGEWVVFVDKVEK